MSNIRIIFSIALFLEYGCLGNKDHQTDIEPKKEKITLHPQRPIAVENGKIFKKGNIKFLYGGEDSVENFNITNCELKDENFHYGIGREKFPALLEPEFISQEEADTIWADTSRFLVASYGGETKAYSIKDLIRHEIVNDKINGKPIMAAYCILANLGAIYERQYDNKIFTFALSGYTYHDANVWNDLDGFVLWDRETESLWWPLIGKAVSGLMHGVKLIELDKKYWEDTNWGKIKRKYKNVKVLKSGQDFERPKMWNKYKNVSDIVIKYSN